MKTTPTSKCHQKIANVLAKSQALIGKLANIESKTVEEIKKLAAESKSVGLAARALVTK